MLYAFKQYKNGLLVYAAEDSDTGEDWVSTFTTEYLLKVPVDVLHSYSFRQFAGGFQPRFRIVQHCHGTTEYCSMDTFEMLRKYCDQTN
jgi:hypothetical protein